MTDNTINSDEWYDEYEEASVRQQYQMLLDILKEPLSQDFLEETEMDELLISMSDELCSNNLIDDHITLFQLVQQQHPKLYKQDFVYYDRFIIAYYLYTKQFDLLEDALVRFKKFPAKDIGYFISVIDLLSFYEQSEVLVDLCQKTYNSIKNNRDAISGVEDEISWVVVTHLMEQVYQKHQQGKDINWSHFEAELQKYDYESDSEWLQDTKQALTQDFDKEQCLAQLKQKKLHSRAFNSLSVAFYIYMKQEKQMSFVCSQGIWEAAFEFLGDRELNFKQQANPNTFFTFSQKNFEEYLTEKIYAFLSTRQAQGFAALWGISYIYDFLLEQEIIREQVHRKVISIVKQLKNDVLKAHENNWELWRYDFINRWQPDANTDASELTKQHQFFTKSFNYSEPLTDQPGEGKLESFFSTMSEKLGVDLEKLRDELKNEDDEENEFSTVESAEPIREILPTKTKSKKKKSNLGLAAQLYNEKAKK